jgi:HPt (histidine-containing phosphotransfer) domain-containing protein
MNDHIAKPIDPAMLFETVARFFKPKAAVPPPPSEASTPHPGSQPADPPPSTGLSGTATPVQTGIRTPAPDELPSIEGLDAKDGLARVAGNRKLYRKLLRQFLEQQGSVVGQITTALAQGDGTLAERLAHPVKGVAGNIGAKPVQAAAGALERLLRDRGPAPEVESAIHRLTAALDPLLARFRECLPPPESITPPASASPAPLADPAQTRTLATQLTKLLSEFDPGAAEFIEANRDALRSLLPGDAWSRFEKLVQGYAFADAEAQLQHALKQLPAA